MHGRGLFARRDVPAGTVVGDYSVGTRRIDERHVAHLRALGRATHVAYVRGRLYDASEGGASVGRINRQSRRTPGVSRDGNARLRGRHVVTTRPVCRGEEFLMPYGASFALNKADHVDGSVL